MPPLQNIRRGRIHAPLAESYAAVIRIHAPLAEPYIAVIRIDARETRAA